MSGTTRSLGEFELIERYFRRASRRPDVILGIGDDAAVLRLPAGAELVVAVDTLVAGRHFPGDSPPHSIGHRALAVNLSDMAAMGATPAWITLALTMPDADPGWLEGFSEGLAALAALHEVELVGGDTTAGPLTISVQIMGHVTRDTALRRGGGRPGDILAVTGTLGDAGAGLALAMGRLITADRSLAEQLIHRFEYPTPRVAFGRAARGLASAAIDVSDGLTGDLPKLANASGVAAHVEVGSLPKSDALRQVVPPVQADEFALAAGDDYELLLAVPPSNFDDLRTVARGLNLTFTAIGELRPGNGVTWTRDGHPFAAAVRGYEHFR